MHFQIGLNINSCMFAMFSSMLPFYPTLTQCYCDRGHRHSLHILIQVFQFIRCFLFCPWKASAHCWCIQKHFLSAVKVVTTLQGCVWRLTFRRNYHNVSDGLESRGMWQCARVTAYYRKQGVGERRKKRRGKHQYFLQHRNSLNMNCSHLYTVVYSRYWF